MEKQSAWLVAILAFLVWSAGAVCAQQVSVESSRGRQDNPVITMIGAVLLQARYEPRRPVRLNELIALSGGMTERAGKTIRIYRSMSASDARRLLADDVFKRTSSFGVYRLADLLRQDANANPYLQAGDVVYVDEPGMVYIAGDVKFPQAIKLTEAVTLRQAIAIAGGLLPGAEKERIIIHRQGVNQAKETIIFSRKDIMGRGKDITLQSNDIVCVQGKMLIGRRCPDAATTPAVSLDELPLRIIR